MLLLRYLIYLGPAWAIPWFDVSRIEDPKGPQLLSDDSVHTRQDRCNDRLKDLIPECWDVLGVSQYLGEWWALKQLDCDSPYYKGSGFASCYQQKLGINNNPCNNIGAKDCDHPTFHDSPNLA